LWHVTLKSLFGNGIVADEKTAEARLFWAKWSSCVLVESKHRPAHVLDGAERRKERVELSGGALEKEAVRDCLYRRPPPPIGAGRVRVRDQLRELLAEKQLRPALQRRQRLLKRAEFDRICDEAGGISDKDTLLDFLHYNGVIFYRPGLFHAASRLRAL
jgi:hypothetical protein